MSILIKDIRAALSVAGVKDHRYYLSSVCFEPKRIIGSDGHRLIEISGTLRIEDRPRQVVTRDVLERLLKCVGSAKKNRELVVELTDTHISVPVLNLSFDVQESRDWTYPDVDRIWPSKFDGIPGAFNWELVAGCQKAARDWLGVRHVNNLEHHWDSSGNRLVLAHQAGFRALIMGLRD